MNSDDTLKELLSIDPAIGIRSDANSLFSELRRSFPAMLGGINWSQAILVEESIALSGESLTDACNRVAPLLDRFQNESAITEVDHVFVLSDGFFDVAFTMSILSVRRALALLIPLPHAIFIVTCDFQWCLHLAFCGNAYLGKRSTQPN